MRYILTFTILLFIRTATNAQNSRLKQVIYFNEQFMPCQKNEASYTGVSIKKEEGTDIILYHYNGKLALTGTYKDQNLLIKNGLFNWFDSTSTRIATIGYKNNKEHGFYLVWYPNKVLKDSGRFDNGVPDGLWKSWYANHQLKLSCTYSARKFNAFKKDWDQEKALQKVRRILTPNDIASISDSIFSVNSGSHIFYPYYFQFVTSADGANSTNLAERNITLNDLNSLSKVCIRKDVINSCFAIMDGEYVFYYPNGQTMYSGNFKAGLKNGLWEIWSDSGHRKSVGMFTKNHEVGEWKYYNSEGSLYLVKRFGKDGIETNQLAIK